MDFACFCLLPMAGALWALLALTMKVNSPTPRTRAYRAPRVPQAAQLPSVRVISSQQATELPHADQYPQVGIDDGLVRADSRTTADWGVSGLSGR